MKQYIIDAFTDRLFSGNPAAVCLPEAWPTEETMLAIARENRLSETAFLVKEPQGWRLRWFTPGGEIDLCGHATLASAFALIYGEKTAQGRVTFHTQSGALEVIDENGLLKMDFPAYDMREVAVTNLMERALGTRPDRAFMGRDLLCVFDGAGIVEGIDPDFDALMDLDGLLCHVTEPGTEGFDCVSRSFAPKLAVPEDPVCGSGHCHIAPYWSARLGKPDVTAYQASERGGVLFCTVESDRVTLGGSAVLFSQGELTLQP